MARKNAVREIGLGLLILLIVAVFCGGCGPSPADSGGNSGYVEAAPGAKPSRKGTGAGVSGEL